MRVTTNLLFEKNFRAINANQSDLARVQEQLATGKKLLRPSDDPVGSAQIIRLTEDVNKIKQYQRKIDLAMNDLSAQDTALQSVQTLMNRARVLTVQSGNGILTEADKFAITEEIKQIRNQTLDLMNSQDSLGNYIFAGFQSETPAFEFIETLNENHVQFKGDDGANQIRISDSVTIQTTSSGQTVFNDVLARLGFQNLTVNGATVNKFNINNQDDFDVFHRNNFDTINPANNQFQLELTAANELTLINQGTGQTLDTYEFSNGGTTTIHGIEVNLSDVQVGDSVSFELETPKKQNIAQTLHNFAIGLSDPTLSDGEVRELITDTLVGIDNAMFQLGKESSSLGGRMNIAQSVKQSLFDDLVSTESALSTVQDLDYAEASAEFSQQETAINAALQSYPLLTRLSLFDYLR